MRKLVLGLGIIILSVQWTQAQNSSAEQAIIDLSKNKWQWMSDKNVDLLKELFHEKAMFVHMGGSWGTERDDH